MRPDFSSLAISVTLADGAWATELRARAYDPTAPPESANLRAPGLVQRLAEEYVGAGAQFLSTNTFGLSRLLRDAVSEKTLAAGVRIARDAAGSNAAVAGVIGPSGRLLAVRGADEAALLALFAWQAGRLVDAGVDCLLLETFSELAELQIALRAVRAAGVPAIASMSFDSGVQHTRTIMGASADECGAALEGAGADSLGCNCGAGVSAALPAVVALRAATERPLWVKPSAGLPDLEDGRPIYRQTPEAFAAAALKLVDAGANIIGGCCGVGPEHVKRLGALLAGRERGKGRPNR